MIRGSSVSCRPARDTSSREGLTCEAPIFTAVEKGFFKEEGLDVEIVRMNANVAMSSLISEDVDYTMIFASVIRAGMRGIPLKVIAVLIDSPPYAFIARPEITAMKALKGKTVGVSRFGAATDFGMRMFLAKHGLAAHADRDLAGGA